MMMVSPLSPAMVVARMLSKTPKMKAKILKFILAWRRVKVEMNLVKVVEVSKSDLIHRSLAHLYIPLSLVIFASTHESQTG